MTKVKNTADGERQGEMMTNSILTSWPRPCSQSTAAKKKGFSVKGGARSADNVRASLRA